MFILPFKPFNPHHKILKNAPFRTEEK